MTSKKILTKVLSIALVCVMLVIVSVSGLNIVTYAKADENQIPSIKFIEPINYNILINNEGNFKV